MIKKTWKFLEVHRIYELVLLPYFCETNRVQSLRVVSRRGSSIKGNLVVTENEC